MINMSLRISLLWVAGVATLLLSGCGALVHRWEVAETKMTRYKSLQQDYRHLVERVERCEANQLAAAVDAQDNNSCKTLLMESKFLEAQAACLGAERSPATAANASDAIRGAIALLYSGSSQAAISTLKSLPEGELRDHWLGIAYLANQQTAKAPKPSPKYLP